ncbi:MAG TPA: N-acetylneuraminate synthase family protein [Sumerlaeia bacterium]|nr:N-acetylneuraminate synthase family protein [Sumerlaeia bacterium]
MPDSRRIAIIGEMACSHEGDPVLARKIIDGAGRAGADAIQFQVWTLKDILVPQHPAWEQCRKLEFSREEWAELARFVRERHPAMQIIGCVGEKGSVEFCREIGVDAYKLHSADLSNARLVKQVAAAGKRIDLSVGASTLDEIQTALEWIRETSDSEIWLMYGYQNFPTPTDAIHLDYMMNIKRMFSLPIGYQDHSDAGSDAAFWLPAAAAGMGVDCLEKHITHDRSRKGTDHEAALNPDEFARFVAMVREIEAARGAAAPRPFSEAELKYRRYAKKTLVAARDLPAGARIGEMDLVALRAEDLGLPPDKAERLIGRTARADIAAFQIVRETDVE